MTRRRFNGREKTALYLAADGRCSNCGDELEPGWHSDHVTPWSAGGPTDVINGQALCPPCNLMKGDSVSVTPRPWQRRFIAKYHANSEPDFLCVACPGAGKTKAAGFIARDLIDSGEVERLFIIVPNGPLRMQWHRALLELGLVVDGSTMNDPDHKNGRRTSPVGEMTTIAGGRVHGWVVTYQSLAMAPELHRLLNSRKRTLAILDEVHHLSVRGSWGSAADHALGPCVRRLSLSGTPFRSDGDKIPFVEYDGEGWSRYADQIAPDGAVTIYPRGFDYSYGVALSDCPSPVRPSIFETFDGDAAWMEFDKQDAQEARISDGSLNKPTRQKANRHVLNAAGQWLRDVLASADRRLTMVRDEGDAEAKGLVVCMDTSHARQVCEVLRRVAGNDQVCLAVSRDSSGEDSTEEARRMIEQFGTNGMRWLVAVAMVSEGVDIPQLRVGVYATTVRSPLFFRQVLGRFVRWRFDLPEDVDQTAYLFIPKDPDMLILADAVQDEIRTAMLKEKGPEGPGGPGGDQPTLDFDSFLRSASEEGGILLPGGGTFERDKIEKVAAKANLSTAVVARAFAAASSLGIDVGLNVPESTVETKTTMPVPGPSYAEMIGSKKSMLEKNLKQIAGWLRRRDGNVKEFPEYISRLKVQVYGQAGISDYRRADLPQIDRALGIARSLWERM